PGFRVLAALLIGLAAAGLFRVAGAGFFSRRMRLRAEYFTAKLVASGAGFLQDLLTIAIWLTAARLARNWLLPEVDLAQHLLNGVINGAAVGATYIAVARFLLAPGAADRRLMPLPRAE